MHHYSTHTTSKSPKHCWHSRMLPTIAEMKTGLTRLPHSRCKVATNALVQNRVGSFRNGRCSVSGIGRRPARPLRFLCRAEKSESQDNESTESLFAKELKRRGINSVKDADKVRPETVRWPKSTSEDGDPPPPDFTDDQIEKSRALSSEGLEGLIPRAKELLKLGGSIFLGFGPFILGITVFAGIVFVVLGPSFIHFGRGDSPPPTYIDPYELLREEAKEMPMVPFNKPPPPSPTTSNEESTTPVGNIPDSDSVSTTTDAGQ